MLLIFSEKRRTREQTTISSMYSCERDFMVLFDRFKYFCDYTQYYAISAIFFSDFRENFILYWALPVLSVYSVYSTYFSTSPLFTPLKNCAYRDAFTDSGLFCTGMDTASFYTLTISPIDNSLSCEDISNNDCQFSHCECDRKTARDLYRVVLQKFHDKTQNWRKMKFLDIKNHLTFFTWNLFVD